MIIAEGGGAASRFMLFSCLCLSGSFTSGRKKRLFVVNFHNFLAQRSCEWSFAKELIVKNFPPYKTRVPYCRRFQDDQHAFTLLKSIACMLDEAFQHKFRLQNEWEISFYTNSLLSNCRFFFLPLYLSSSPSSSRAVFVQTPADERTPPGNQHLRNAIWAFQRHKGKTNNAGEMRG